MNREDLEHIIRAAADVTNEYEFIIVGSQSILGPIPYPPEVFRMSAEADIYLAVGSRCCKSVATTFLRPDIGKFKGRSGFLVEAARTAMHA